MFRLLLIRQVSKGGTAHRELGLPTFIINPKKKKNVSRLPTGQFDGGGNSSVELLPSQLSLVCAKLTKTNQYKDGLELP